jgi:hypothetical protein
LTLFALFGVFGESTLLKTRDFASGIEILSFVTITPKNLIVFLATIFLMSYFDVSST